MEPARVYVSTSLDIFGYATRYVLYDDGGFALQFSSAHITFFEYPGTYTKTNGAVDFRFKANAPAWWATGAITEESLSVKYNDVMVWDDFIDAVYVRSR